MKNSDLKRSEFFDYFQCNLKRIARLFLTLYCANAKKSMPYFIAYYKNNFPVVKALTFCLKNVILLVLIQ